MREDVREGVREGVRVAVIFMSLRGPHLHIHPFTSNFTHLREHFGERLRALVLEVVVPQAERGERVIVAEAVREQPRAVRADRVLPYPDVGERAVRLQRLCEQPDALRTLGVCGPEPLAKEGW